MESAEQVLWKIMKRVKSERLVWMPRLVCPECRGVPLSPVTGECGHTWCGACARDALRCACGAPPPEEGAPDVLVRRLVDVMFRNERDAAEECRRADLLLTFEDTVTTTRVCVDALLLDPRNVQLRLTLARTLQQTGDYRRAKDEIDTVMRIDPRLPEAHFVLALVLKAQEKRDAALRSFFMSCLLGKPLTDVRDHIIELIEVAISTAKRSDRLIRKMRLGLRATMKQCNVHQTESLQLPEKIDATELECIVCSLAFLRPVTTPCGHTFCRLCVQRCLDHNLDCPLCNGPLEKLRDDDAVQDSAFVATISARLPPELKCRVVEKSDMLPLMICTAGFPSVSCPLLIKEGRYRLMVRRCMETGNRRFGMISCRLGTPMDPPLRYAEFGTVLEIRDCVTRPDGCLILSTVGVNRFRVVTHDELDGYDVAFVEPVCDKVGAGVGAEYMRLYTSVRSKALLWMHQMVRAARTEIENSFGPMPPDDLEWEEDGPAWVWWLLAALPLTVQLKRMLLGTTELILRLRAIDKTLDLRKWSLRERLHESSFEPLETDDIEYETPVSPNVEEWLVGPGSLDDAAM